MIGLDIGQTAVRGVRMTTGLLRSQVVATFEQKIERHEASDPFSLLSDGQISAIRALVSQGKIEKNDSLAFAFSGHQIPTRQIVLPFKDMKKMRQVLPFEMEDRLPFALDEVTIADYPLGPNGDAGVNLLVFAAPKTRIEAARDRLRETGLSFGTIGIDILALDFLFRRAGVPAFGDIFLIDIGASKSLLCHLKEGTLQAVRAIPIGGDAVTTARQGAFKQTWSQAEREKLEVDLSGDDRPAEVSRAALVVWAMEIEKWMASLSVSERRVFCLVGGGAQLRGLSDWLAARWGFPALKTPTGITPFSQAEAIGRQALSAGGVNFTDPARRAQKRPSRHPARAAAALLLVAGLAATDITLAHRQQENRYQALKQRLHNRLTALFPQAKNAAGRELEYLRTAMTRLNKTATDLSLGRIGALTILAAVTSGIPDGTLIDVQEMTINGDNVRIEASTDSFQSVDRIRAVLARDRRFSAVSVSDAKASVDGSKVAFLMQMTAASDTVVGGAR